MPQKQITIRLTTAAVLVATLLSAAAAMAQTPAPAAANGPTIGGQSVQDIKAKRVLNRGLELFETGQDERAAKLLLSLPRQFPTSKVRFRAHMALAAHYTEKADYERAIRQFAAAAKSEDANTKADSLYQTGICYYRMNQYDKAFSALRLVTNDYPGSVYANEAYYYIGQCHFKLGRWAKAVDALQRVGTSVSTDKADGPVLAEAGQHLFFKVRDKDLVVLNTEGVVKAEIVAKSGDREQIALRPLGKDGSHYIGGIATALGKPKPGDGTLQIIGGDEATATYIDANTLDGKRHQKILASVKLVSTAAVGFTDGAYKDYVEGIMGDGDCFIRAKDLDRDTTDVADTVTVRVSTRYKVKKDAKQLIESNADFANIETREIWRTRDTITLKLTEKTGHSGVFVGSTVPRVVAEDGKVNTNDAVLSAMKGDELICRYVDQVHLRGDEPIEVTGQAKVLIGQINDVQIRYWEVDTPEQKARKNLIEGNIYLKLGDIFKEVGLTAKAYEKADLGLERIDEVIAASLKGSMDQELVEQAFSVKWELLLVKDKLTEAIAVCKTLMELFPESSLVDAALMKIGQAKMAGGKLPEAVAIFRSIIQLPKSDLKAEAQYNIAVAYETSAAKSGGGQGNSNMSKAILAFQTCAETYPDSSFAGESLEKIANFYIATADYARAIELMERVFMEHPDASFLDRMLLRWAEASIKQEDYKTAKAKCEQLLADFPGSKLSKQAQKHLSTINARLGS